MRAAVLAILAALAAPAAAQDGIPAGGTDILRGLLKYNGFTPLERFNADPSSLLIVVVGSTDALPPQTAWAIRTNMLPRGASLLVISDQPSDLRRVFPGLGGARVSAASVRCDVRDKCFGGDPHAPLPQLRDGDPTGMAALGPALATGRPHALEWVAPGNDLTVEVAKFPKAAHFVGDAPDLDGFEPALALRTPAHTPYTGLVYADRAMFTNRLMTAALPGGPPAANFAYAYRLTRFFADGLRPRAGDRRTCYFVEDGRVVTDFDRVSFMAAPGDRPNLPPGAMPPIPLPLLADKALDMANGAIDRLDERDLAQAFQKNDDDNRKQDGVLFAAAIIAGVVLLRYVAARGWGLRQSPDLVPRLRIDPDRGGGLIPERRLALLASGNLYEPLRDHLRFVFARWGVTSPDPGQLPNIVVDRKTRPVARLVADLRRLWYLAYIPERVSVSPIDLEEFEDMIADLAHAHDKGIWRFAAGGAA